MVYEKEVGSDGHTVYIGLGNGQIQEFRLSSDLNRFEKKRTLQSTAIIVFKLAEQTL